MCAAKSHIPLGRGEDLPVVKCLHSVTYLWPVFMFQEDILVLKCESAASGEIRQDDGLLSGKR